MYTCEQPRPEESTIVCDAGSLSILLFKINSSACSPGCQRASWCAAVHTSDKKQHCWCCPACVHSPCTDFMHGLSCFALWFVQKPAGAMETSSPSCPESVGWFYMLWPLTCTPTPALGNVTGFCRMLEPGESDNQIICSRSEKQVLNAREDDVC